MSFRRKSKQDFREMESFDDDDISGSENELSDSDRRLLEKVRRKHVPETFDSDDEVLGVQDAMDDDDGHDSMESDIERPEEDDDLPDERAWGKKKRDYYSADYVDADYATTSHKDMAEAEFEEQEARKIQQRLAEQLDDADFGLDLLPVSAEAEGEGDDMQIVKKDLSQMSKREKRELFRKENPEFEPLVTDIIDRLTESKDILMPFLDLVKREKIADCPAIDFLKTKHNLTLNYCVNISFYLMLKAKRIATASHPVMKRLAQYRQLLNKLEERQEDLLEEVSRVLEANQAGEPLYNILDNSVIQKKKSKKMKSIDVEKSEKTKKASVAIPEPKDHAEDEELSVNEEDKILENGEEIEHEPAMFEVSEGEKRAITYQIAKNKGLTPHRKKELRNPRVKLRNKYRQAKIRRKGAVREVRTETSRYAGEISGIKASVKKSIKLK